MPLLPSLLRLATIAAWGTSGPPLRPRAKRNRVLRRLGVRHRVFQSVACRLPVAHYWQQTVVIFTTTITVFTTWYLLHGRAAPLKPPQRIIEKRNGRRKIWVVCPRVCKHQQGSCAPRWQRSNRQNTVTDSTKYKTKHNGRGFLLLRATRKHGQWARGGWCVRLRPPVTSRRSFLTPLSIVWHQTSSVSVFLPWRSHRILST